MKAQTKFAEITARIDPSSGKYVVAQTSVDEAPGVRGLPSVSGETFEIFMRVAAQAVVDRILGAETLRITHPDGEVFSVDLRFECNRPRVA